jgi:hypothetical protein
MALGFSHWPLFLVLIMLSFRFRNYDYRVTCGEHTLDVAEGFEQTKPVLQRLLVSVELRSHPVQTVLSLLQKPLQQRTWLLGVIPLHSHTLSHPPFSCWSPLVENTPHQAVHRWPTGIHLHWALYLEHPPKISTNVTWPSFLTRSQTSF